MSSNFSKSRKIKEAVLHSPLLIPHYLKDPSYNNVMTRRILNQLIPFRVGIELECGGNLSKGLTDNNIINIDSVNLCNNWETIEKHYKIINFGTDPVNSGMREHKISFDNRSITGFYKILEDMKLYCIENKEGGCHIHINNIYYKEIMQLMTTKESQIWCNFYNKIKKYGESLLNEVSDIFGGYEGSYNRKEFRVLDKGGWFCMRSNSCRSTYEFRIGKCNFDYETIIKWVIGCSSIVKKMNNKVKQSLRINKKEHIKTSDKVIGKIDISVMNQVEESWDSI